MGKTHFERGNENRPKCKRFLEVLSKTNGRKGSGSKTKRKFKKFFEVKRSLFGTTCVAVCGYDENRNKYFIVAACDSQATTRTSDGYVVPDETIIAKDMRIKQKTLLLRSGNEELGKIMLTAACKSYGGQSLSVFKHYNNVIAMFDAICDHICLNGADGNHISVLIGGWRESDAVSGTREPYVCATPLEDHRLRNMKTAAIGRGRSRANEMLQHWRPNMSYQLGIEIVTKSVVYASHFPDSYTGGDIKVFSALGPVTIKYTTSFDYKFPVEPLFKEELSTLRNSHGYTLAELQRFVERGFRR